MTEFNFTPMRIPTSAPTKIDLPNGLSLMVYISQEDEPSDVYTYDELLGDEWKFVQFSRQNKCCHTEDAFQLLGVNSDGTPNLESLLDNHTEAVIKATQNEPFAEYVGRVSEFQSDEQKIEWLREGLHSDSAINRFMLGLWHTGLATDQKVAVLDVYSHSGEMWSFTGQGLQCEWDTAHGAGALLPSDSMREMLDELAKTDPRDMRVLVHENAKDYLEGFNSINQGDLWQIIGELVETATGFEIDNTVFPINSGGYLGVEQAYENFKQLVCDYKKFAIELDASRKAAWSAKLLTIAQQVLKLSGFGDSVSEELIVKVLGEHLTPPMNFKWAQNHLNLQAKMSMSC